MRRFLPFLQEVSDPQQRGNLVICLSKKTGKRNDFGFWEDDDFNQNKENKNKTPKEPQNKRMIVVPNPHYRRLMQEGARAARARRLKEMEKIRKEKEQNRKEFTNKIRPIWPSLANTLDRFLPWLGTELENIPFVGHWLGKWWPWR